MKIGGGQLVEILPIADLYGKYHNHKRLRVFVKKGRECVACGREGVMLVKSVYPGGDVHVDLVSADFILMTRDHIIPKAKGGKDGLYNMQTMCEPCNRAKADKLVDLAVWAKTRPKPVTQRPTCVIRELVLKPVLFGIQIQKA